MHFTPKGEVGKTLSEKDEAARVKIEFPQQWSVEDEECRKVGVSGQSRVTVSKRFGSDPDRFGTPR
jgi:hypothetical protein